MTTETLISLAVLIGWGVRSLFYPAVRISCSGVQTLFLLTPKCGLKLDVMPLRKKSRVRYQSARRAWNRHKVRVISVSLTFRWNLVCDPYSDEESVHRLSEGSGNSGRQPFGIRASPINSNSARDPAPKPINLL